MLTSLKIKGECRSVSVNSVINEKSSESNANVSVFATARSSAEEMMRGTIFLLAVPKLMKHSAPSL